MQEVFANHHNSKQQDLVAKLLVVFRILLGDRREFTFALCVWSAERKNEQ
jgi:hypothetical protein